jgi:hypothetical protein
MAERLNNAAEAIASTRELEHGSIGWIAQRYRDSVDYRKLTPCTA